ncbi:hypothetical protein [Flagellimonas sp. SN16]|uniref:hypothetical protein n=1 Tax=Flagellimonas sp. SN16 TaxID=3415142 RepID=UPI003C405805
MNKHKKFIKDCYEGKHGTMCQEWKERILEHYPEFVYKCPENGWAYCHTDLVMKSDGTVNAKKGKCYYIIRGAFTNESGNPDHIVGANGSSWFRKATTKEIVSHLEVEILRLM